MPGFQEFAPGIQFLKAGQGKWSPTPYAGVTYKLLHVDKAAQTSTVFLRLQPGAKYPSHRHKAVEHCLVVEGDVRLGELSLTAGDYERADGNTDHGTITTDNGCTLLIMASLHDEVHAH